MMIGFALGLKVVAVEGVGLLGMVVFVGRVRCLWSLVTVHIYCVKLVGPVLPPPASDRRRLAHWRHSWRGVYN